MILQRENVLAQEQVLAVEVQPNPAYNSVTTHLKLTFSATVSSSPPERLLLKCNRKEPWAISAGVREVQFYQTVARLPTHPSVIVRCYDAVVDNDTGNSHILLRDLSESHTVPVTRDQQLHPDTSVPSNEHLEQAVDTLARFHAFWWENALLGTGVAQVGTWCRNQTCFTGEVTRRQRAWNHLCEHEHSWFPSYLTTLYEEILQNMHALWQQYTQPRLASYSHLTLTHGDAYLANFLCPRPGHDGATYLIDWQSPEVYRGTGDLVNMCATFWTRAQRSIRERWILERYHQVLQEHGVTGYPWNALITDYQYSIIDWLLNTLQDRMDGSDKTYWYGKMRCLADAYEDWNCSMLFADGGYAL